MKRSSSSALKIAKINGKIFTNKIYIVDVLPISNMVLFNDKLETTAFLNETEKNKKELPSIYIRNYAHLN